MNLYYYKKFGVLIAWFSLGFLVNLLPAFVLLLVNDEATVTGRTLMVCLFFGIVVALPAALPGRLSYFFSASLTLFVLTLSLLQSFHVYTFTDRASLGTMVTVLNSNASETKEFIGQYLSFTQALFGTFIVLVVSTIIYFFRPRATGSSLFAQSALVAACLSLYVFGTQPRYWVHRSFEYGHDSIRRVVHGLEKSTPTGQNVAAEIFRWYTQQRTRLANFGARFPNQIKTAAVAEDSSPSVVLILGEATARAHMSLYGYERETTPRLSARTDTINFSNAIAPRALTYFSVLESFYLSDLPYNSGHRMPSDWATVTGLFSSAGYHTTWISNQIPLGSGHSTSQYLADHADQTVFTSQHGQILDNAVITELETTLAAVDGRQLVVVHLNGAHSDYCNRAPDSSTYHFEGLPEYARNRGLSKKQQRILNCYDGAIKYQDMIVDRLFRVVERAEANVFAVFFPDHGEEVYREGDFAGHSEDRATAAMFEIPLIVWPSVEWRTANPDLLQHLSENVDTPYNTTDILHTVAHMASLSHSLVDESKSLASGHLTTGGRYSLSQTLKLFNRQAL